MLASLRMADPFVISHRRMLALLLALFASLAIASVAAAQDEDAADDPALRIDGLGGAVSGLFLASPTPDFGGALAADLWYANGIFRVGGFLGVGAVPSADDVYNRVFMPLGVSAGIEVLGDVIGFSVRVRGGLWGGATQAVKITAGGFVGGGAYLLYSLGGGVGVGLGLDVWGLFGDGETILFAPGLGLTWTPVEGS